MTVYFKYESWMFSNREINFTLRFFINRTNWTVVSISTINWLLILNYSNDRKKRIDNCWSSTFFLCTSLNDVCVNMYRFRNLEIEIYSSQSINSLLFDIINMNAIFERIQKRLIINVEMNVIFNDKIFQKQLIELQKLHKNEFYRW